MILSCPSATVPKTSKSVNCRGLSQIHKITTVPVDHCPMSNPKVCNTSRQIASQGILLQNLRINFHLSNMAKICNSKSSIFWLPKGGACVSTVSFASFSGLASSIGLVFDVDAACAWQKHMSSSTSEVSESKQEKNCIQSCSQILIKLPMFKSFNFYLRLFQNPSKSQSLWYLPQNSQVRSSRSQSWKLYVSGQLVRKKSIGELPTSTLEEFNSSSWRYMKIYLKIFRCFDHKLLNLTEEHRIIPSLRPFLQSAAILGTWLLHHHSTYVET